MPEPIRRTTARVVPVNRDGEVLLLYGCDPKHPDDRYWFTIGGAVEAGETLSQAGARELLEETGIDVPAEQLVGPYHRGFHEFSWNGLELANDSHFFAVRLDDVTVSFAGLEPAETGNVLDSGWFAPDVMPGDLSDPDLSDPDLPVVARLAGETVRP